VAYEVPKCQGHQEQDLSIRRRFARTGMDERLTKGVTLINGTVRVSTRAWYLSRYWILAPILGSQPGNQCHGYGFITKSR
jgi:hypothetical protein